MEIEEEKDPQHTRLLPDEVKWRIVFFKKEGYSNKETARRISNEYARAMSHQTVKKIWTLYEETKSVECQWNLEGRPKVLNEDQIERLIESCEEDRMLTVKERKEDLELEASLSTINKTLLDFGYRAYKARKKPH